MNRIARHTNRNCTSRVAAATGYSILAALVIARAAAGQQVTPGTLPFGVGEKFTYTARTQTLGTIGKGEMWIEGPVDVRGVSTWLLRFEIKGGLGPLGSSERSSSWLDAGRMTSLRFAKRSRRLLKGSQEEVELFPDEGRWTGLDGKSGVSLTARPLDELSYIYFIRTMPLEMDSVYTMDRHFDAARNPTVIRVVGRDTIDTKAGTFSTLKVEMLVKDARNFEKQGVIRLYLSDDARRIPVRIESEMPIVGMATLTLESHTCAALAAVAPEKK